jgi:ABC-2 type transport system permease protein
MGNVMVIARKEFADLLSNRMVLLIVVAFMTYNVFWAYDFYNVLNGGKPGAQILFNDNMGIAADNNVFFLLCWFGTILGVIIGCSTISSERMGNALNTQTTKPLYRDTIINGKILGSLTFMAIVTVFMIFIYTSVIFILCGSAVAPFMFDYFSRLPFVFLFVMVFVLVFLSLSMFFSLLVKDQAFAMILGTLTVYVSYLFTSIVTHNLNNILPGNGITGFLTSFSPYSIMWEGGVQQKFMNTSQNAWDAFLAILPDFTRLLLLVIVIMAINYTIFVRRDIS